MSATYVPSEFSELSGSITTASISDFAEGVDDRVSALLIAGTGVTLTYNDASGTLTIAASGGGGTIGPTLDLNTTAGAAGAVNATSHATKGVLSLNGSCTVGVDGAIASTGPRFDMTCAGGSRFLANVQAVDCILECRPGGSGTGSMSFYDAGGFNVFGFNIVPWSAIYFDSSMNRPIIYRMTGAVVLSLTVAESVIATPATATGIGCVVKGFASQSGNLQEWRSSADAVYGTVSENGYWTTRKTSAPADGELVAGEAAFWLDATNGAAKLMVRAKQADGTVRSGSITLS